MYILWLINTFIQLISIRVNQEINIRSTPLRENFGLYIFPPCVDNELETLLLEFNIFYTAIYILSYIEAMNM